MLASKPIHRAEEQYSFCSPHAFHLYLSSLYVPVPLRRCTVQNDKCSIELDRFQWFTLTSEDMIDFLSFRASHGRLVAEPPSSSCGKKKIMLSLLLVARKILRRRPLKQRYTGQKLSCGVVRPPLFFP